MLIFSTERYLPGQVNMLVIKDSEDNYYYIHRSLYDMAVIIEDRYSAHPADLVEALTGDANTTVSDVIMNFVEEVPQPINILGYYLLLIQADISDFDIKDCCGALHVMSGVFSFREFLKVPKELRRNVRFSLSIREEYELGWDRFFQEAIPYDGLSQPVYSSPLPSTMNAEDLPDDLADLDDDEIDFGFDFSSDSSEGEEEEEEVPAASTSAPESPVVSGLNKLKGL